MEERIKAMCTLLKMAEQQGIIPHIHDRATFAEELITWAHAQADAECGNGRCGHCVE